MSSSSQVPLQNWTYDVFLTYHDEDMGKSFADDLSSALTQAGHVVYANNHNLTTEHQMNSSAIEGSRTSIIVFSRNFDASTWFLEEIDKILECSEKIGQVFVPVFYDVTPSEVRHQTAMFGEAFEDQSILTQDESMRYRKALTQAANISGFHVMSSRNENTYINDIVQQLTFLIKDKYFFVAKHPVGVEAQVQDVIQLLSKEQPNVIIIGIWGITGVGKTTIAKATYNQMVSSFEGTSFLSDISIFCKQIRNGLVSLQEQLLSDIYKTLKIKINTVETGKMLLQKRLSHKKIFLVLDDVNNLDHLNALCGSREGFGHGSRIIITTSDKHILRSLQVDHVYKMKYMDNTESLELFSWHAFDLPSPVEDYAELCREVVEYCGGLPLALEVLGSFFFHRSVTEWKIILQKLKTIPNHIIMENIRTNFDDLSDNEKETFLDITTLFIGMDKDDVIQTLDFSGRYPHIEIKILEEKSLITVDSKNRIGMHTLVHAMGREIIRKQSMGMRETKMYDVFLSFRGEDSNGKFISHLYSSIENAGIYVFKDDNGIQRGDQISNSLLQAIGRSRISIVVLSRNFANSKWCMLELERIVEIGRTKDIVVVPVFYEVDRSEVRHQTGKFGESFEYLVSTISVDEYTKRNWRAALYDVGGIAGIVIINSRNENEDIKKIVDLVTHLLDKTKLFVADYPVRIESRVQDVIQLLDNQKSKDLLLLGIWGMGGIGKTTIAKAVYNEISHDFEATSFLSNVRDAWKLDSGKAFLQQQLLSDICKSTKIKIDNVESGKMILQERLRKKRIFLVIDDVSKLDQLNALCGNRKWFGEGSRIIITTSDKHILRSLPVDHVYTMKYMDNTESLELFSWHAFRTMSPMEPYTYLCRDVVKYCEGLPLALKVIGSIFLDRSVEYWLSALEKLKTIPNNIIMKKMRTNFDDLLDDVEKETFLDITTLFIEMDKDDVIQTLNFSGRFSDIVIKVLEDKSLVTVVSKDRIGMHTLVRAMGREILRQQSMGMAETKMYDVFLSFRGEDSRARFISHLYSSFENAAIYVYKDDDGIQRGDQISDSLLQAIGQSRISIVVLSRNFANSKWCMLELERIVEIGRTKGMVVVPVFYEVDPSEVRHQTGKFGESFEYLISTISVDENTKKNWKTALHEVGGIAGIVIINSRNESEDIKKIVDLVTHLLDKTKLPVADHPVGVESRVQDVIQLLDSKKSKDRLLLGIWGMGGIGKTTIAKAVYNKISHDFEAKSFLLNVRDAWKLDNDKVSLQQRLLSDIYKTTKVKIDEVESGKMILQERLRKKRIFLVIDDVNKLDQLNALCGNRKWFGEGSRIIITTRDDDLLCRHEVDHVYRMKQMGDSESLELFNWHAFKQPTPSEGFTNLSRDVVKYSGGLPLALQVIGSFLLTRRSEAEWNSVLDKLKLIPDGEVSEKLKISFDGLSDDDMKDIFLDIAFFFIGMDREDVTNILVDCGHFPEIGISILVQQSLITVDRKNKIGMHDLLRDMGRDIVRKESKDKGKEPSRLWRYEDVHELSKDIRSLDVKGLTLKMSADSTTYLETKAFEKMDKLRLLQLAGVQLDGDYKCLSRHLRWLSWHGFPLKFTPADFHQDSLVSLNLKCSNLERVWRKSQFLVNLKILNLSHSHNLRYTPDFSNLPNLEKLILKDCPRLSSVSFTIGFLKKILLINLKDCTGLRELPRSIYKLESVKTLILSGCTKIDKLEEDIEQMKSLTTLVADNTAITRVPFAVVRSKSIGFISLCGYEGFARKVFPSIIRSWLSPTNKIPSLIQTSAGTPCLDFTNEQNKSFYCLPSIFEDLQILQRLWLKCDSGAQLNQIVASILDSFNTQNCKGFSNIGTSTLSHCCNQVCISSSRNSLTSLLIQMGVSCNVTNVLRENILQKMPPIGSGLLPGDNYPNWLTFNSNCSSVTFQVPQLDGRNLKTIMCIVYSSSPYNTTTEGFQFFLVINCTKNTIQVYKRDALLAFFDEEEWQRVISNIEPSNEIKVVVLTNELVVKKTTIYLVYDKPCDEKVKHSDVPDENGIVSSGGEAIFGRLFFALPSLARAVLVSRPFWFCLTGGIMAWSSRYRSDNRRRGNPILRELASTSSQGFNSPKSLDQNPLVHGQEVKKHGQKMQPTFSRRTG